MTVELDREGLPNVFLRRTLADWPFVEARGLNTAVLLHLGYTP